MQATIHQWMGPVQINLITSKNLGYRKTAVKITINK